MKIYVASSWRNAYQPTVVEALRKEGHEVYDFRKPNGEPGSGFSWSDVDKELRPEAKEGDWQNWTVDEYFDALEHPVSRDGFDRDMTALQNCDACVLVLPCGRSAHLELGWAIGNGKPSIILMRDTMEPELMYRMSRICKTLDDVVHWAAHEDQVLELAR